MRPSENLLCLAEMAEWNRLATVSPNGLIDWCLMGHTMVPAVQANASGLHHDCSTWDELYEDDDGELVNAWNGPTSSTAPRRQRQWHPRAQRLFSQMSRMP